MLDPDRLRLQLLVGRRTVLRGSENRSEVQTEEPQSSQDVTQLVETLRINLTLTQLDAVIC